MFLLGIPGAIGAYLGAVVLSNLSLAAARPYVSLILLTLGLIIVVRFIHGRRRASQAEGEADETPKPTRPRWLLVPLGLIGGFVDASGGGGWGPVTTSTLVASRQLSARTTIGTVNAAELAVARCSKHRLHPAPGHGRRSLGHHRGASCWAASWPQFQPPGWCVTSMIARSARQSGS